MPKRQTNPFLDLEAEVDDSDEEIENDELEGGGESDRDCVVGDEKWEAGEETITVQGTGTSSFSPLQQPASVSADDAAAAAAAIVELIKARYAHARATPPNHDSKPEPEPDAEPSNGTGLLFDGDDALTTQVSPDHSRWVRSARGPYAGDLAWVEGPSAMTGPGYYGLWVVPRIPVASSTPRGPPTKRPRMARSPAWLLPLGVLQEAVGIELTIHGHGSTYMWRGNTFGDGLLRQTVHAAHTRCALTTLRGEVVMFDHAKAFVPRADLQLLVQRCAEFDLHAGTRVVITSGAQKDLPGVLISVDETCGTLGGVMGFKRLQVPLYQLRHLWKIGDNVTVNTGPRAGQEGRVVAIDDMEVVVQTIQGYVKNVSDTHHDIAFGGHSAQVDGSDSEFELS